MTGVDGKNVTTLRDPAGFVLAEMAIVLPSYLN
jgi:hypothetical protein